MSATTFDNLVQAFVVTVAIGLFAVPFGLVFFSPFLMAM